MLHPINPANIFAPKGVDTIIPAMRAQLALELISRPNQHMREILAQHGAMIENCGSMTRIEAYGHVSIGRSLGHAVRCWIAEIEDKFFNAQLSAAP